MLGVEVGEKFRIADYPVDYGDVAVFADGKVRRVRPNPPYAHADKIGANALYHIINHPEYIKRRPHWTEQEVEDAKAIRRLMSEYTHISRKEISYGTYLSLESEDVESYALSSELFPSLRAGETVELTDIIGGNT